MKIVNILLYIIVQIYTTHIILKCYSNISGEKINYKKSKKYFYIILIGTLILYLNNNYNFSSTKILICYLVTLIMNYLYFKDDFRDIFYNSTLTIILLVLLEILYSLLIPKNTSIVTSNFMLYIKLMLSIIVFKTADVITRKEKIRKFVYRTKDLIREKMVIKLLLLLILVIFDILLFFRTHVFNINSYLTIIINSIYIIITIMEILKSEFIIEKVTAKNNELLKLYEIYKESYDEYRKLKHNLKNDLLTIKSLCNKNQQKIINEVIKKYNTNLNWINDISSIPDGIQGLLYLKKTETEKKGIDLIVNFQNKIDINAKDYVDICDILGILIDNGIDACINNNDSKIILIEIFNEKKKLHFKVVNQFKNTIDTNKIGDKNYSTKVIKSGIGLNYINNIKNKKIKIHRKIINNIFITDVEYKNVK